MTNQPVSFLDPVSPASITTHQISVNGRMRDVPALRAEGVVVTVNGGFIKMGKIFDAFWLEAAKLPDPRRVVEQLKTVDLRPDLFTFTQRAPDTTPKFDFHLEWDNIAAIPISSHGHWLQKQISAASRRNVRTSEKKGVTVRSSPFDERYIRGIMAISDESPIRAGRQYWHYGKDFATVDAEQGTYRERSTFLGAYLGDEQIGYLKLVWDTDTAAIMQIVSKMEHRDKRTNNALLSEAVKLCAERGVGHLLYERFVYGNKVDSSLTRFKRENGFVRMDVPCYFVPLTNKGRLVLRLGLHKSLKDRLPQWMTDPLLELRDKWYARQTAGQ
jgi:hypothetical protein